MRDVLFAIDCDSAKDRTLTVAEVNDLLDKLAAAQGLEQKGAVLKVLLKQRSSPRTAHYLVQIILRNLKAGVSEGALFEAWHKDAMTVYNSTSSLLRVCEDLKDPRASGGGGRVEVGAPAQPYMAKVALSVGPLPAAAAAALRDLESAGALGPIGDALPTQWPPVVQASLDGLLAPGAAAPASSPRLAPPPPSSLDPNTAPPFYLEKKFDGYRIQLHVDGDGKSKMKRNTTRSFCQKHPPFSSPLTSSQCSQPFSFGPVKPSTMAPSPSSPS